MPAPEPRGGKITACRKAGQSSGSRSCGWQRGTLTAVRQRSSGPGQAEALGGGTGYTKGTKAGKWGDSGAGGALRKVTPL